MNKSLFVFFLNFIGFTINMLPFMALHFIPFKEEAFRIHISKKALYMISSAFVMVIAILFSCLTLLGFDSETTAVFLANFVILGGICMILFFIRGSFTKKFTVWMYAYFYLNMMEQFVGVCLLIRQMLRNETIMLNDIFGNVGYFYYDRYNIVCRVIITILLFPTFASFEKKILKPYLDIVKKGTMWIQSILLFILMVFYFFLNTLYVTFYVDLFTETEKYVYILAIPGIAIIFFSILLGCLLIFRNTLTKYREYETEKQLELMKESSKNLQREIEHARELHHDIRQLLRQVNTISDKYDIHELDGYIEKIVSLTDHTDTVFCENTCLNALFQYYTGLANEKQVPIHITANCPDVSIEDSDLTILVANILENAITSAEEYRNKMDKEPLISVTAGIVKKHLAMQISNSCAGVLYASNIPETSKGSFLSADAYKSTHEDGGHGLKRIYIITDKYNGLSQFSYNSEKCEWTTRISIPTK